MPKVDLEGVSLHYVEAGSGSPVVLIHGIGGDHRDWLLQLNTLSKHFRVLAVDLRGHGLSSRAESYTMRDFASDIFKFIRVVCGGKAHVCGISMGGMVSLQLAVDYPQAVCSLTLVDTSACVDPETVKCVSAWVRLYLQSGFEAYFEQLVKGVFHHRFVQENPSFIRNLKEIVSKRDLSSLIDVARGTANFDLRDKLGMIKQPTLIVHGENDTVIPLRQAYVLREGIPNVKLVVLKECGHAPIVEKPGEFNSLLLEFLRSVSC